MLEGEAGPSQDEHDAVIARADAAVAGLRRTFFATPYRPTGLSTPARTVVRLVDELSWLNTIVVQTSPHPDRIRANRAACVVKSQAASVLERGADLLDETGGDSEALDAALAELHEALVAMELSTTVSCRPRTGSEARARRTTGGSPSSSPRSTRASGRKS